MGATTSPDLWSSTLSALHVLHQQQTAVTPLLQTVNSLQNNLAKQSGQSEPLVQGMVNSLASLYCNIRLRAEAECLLADEVQVHVRALLRIMSEAANTSKPILERSQLRDAEAQYDQHSPWHHQLPITIGRPVAMRQTTPVNVAAPGKAEDIVYVLARVRQSFSETEYEVQDVDHEEDVYRVSLDQLLPLPWAEAPPGHAQHFPAVEYKVGSRVMAVYPSTTAFYPATILETPKQMAASARKAHMAMGPVSRCYRLHFDADDVPSRLVPIQHVMQMQV